MTNYSVTGNITAQVAEGQTITIDVTAPDATAVPQQTALTLADLSYSDAWADATTIQVGVYTAKFHIAADTKFTAADWSATFEVLPAPVARTGTGTLSVTP